jgi:hypothetical protein
MAIIKSGASSDQWDINPFKSGKVVLYDSFGETILPSNHIQTFSAATPSFTPGATPQDIFTLTCQSTRVQILKFGISGNQTTSGINNWFCRKRSSVNSGGTFVPVTIVSHNSADFSPTATLVYYTANPTSGVSIGDIWSGKIPCPAVTPIVLDFSEKFGKPVTLWPNQSLSWNFNGAALPTGLSVMCFATWMEF